MKLFLFGFSVLLLVPFTANAIITTDKSFVEEQKAIQPLPQDLMIFDLETKKIADTIKYIETRGNDKARGASGERGAWQTMPGTYRALTKKHLGEVKAFSTTTQELVVYKEIQELRLKNIPPAKIFLLWNSGSYKRPCKTGINSHGVRYDSCGYVKRSLNFYNKLK